MTTPVWSLAEEHKFGRIFFYHLSPFSSFRTTKIRQNFFVPSAHSIILDTSVSSLHGSTRLSYPYPHRSRLSILFSPIDHLRLNPSSKFLSIRSCALRILYVFLLFILPPRLVASTFCPRQYHSSFLALLGVPCIQCSRWV